MPKWGNFAKSGHTNSELSLLLILLSSLLGMLTTYLGKAVGRQKDNKLSKIKKLYFIFFKIQNQNYFKNQSML